MNQAVETAAEAFAAEARAKGHSVQVRTYQDGVEIVVIREAWTTMDTSWTFFPFGGLCLDCDRSGGFHTRECPVYLMRRTPLAP